MQEGINQLLQANLNGRYVGNFFEVIMTRSELLKTIIMGGCCFLIPYMLTFFTFRVQKCNNHKLQTACFILCNILLLTMDRAMWRQTYGWVAGFANFCISAIFLMVWICEIDLVFRETIVSTRSSVMQCIVLCIICILAQLFLENIAIYTVILALFIIGIYYIRTRKTPLKSIAMLLGAIIGLFIIFSSSVYDSLWSTGEAVGGYRQLTAMIGWDLKAILYNLILQAAKLAPKIFENNLILTLTILILLTALLVKKKKRSKLSCVLIIANLVFLIYFLSNYIFSRIYRSGVLYATATRAVLLLALACNALYFCIVTIEIIVLFKDSKWFMGKVLVIWISAPIVISPLAFTSEIGARLFFTSNIFIILFAAILFAQLFKYSSSKTSTYSTITCLIISLIVIIPHGYIYAKIGECKQERALAIEQALETGSAVVTLPKFPYENYLWYPDPLPGREDFFRRFYKIPENLEIIIE